MRASAICSAFEWLQVTGWHNIWDDVPPSPINKYEPLRTPTGLFRAYWRKPIILTFKFVIERKLNSESFANHHQPLWAFHKCFECASTLSSIGCSAVVIVVVVVTAIRWIISYTVWRHKHEVSVLLATGMSTSAQTLSDGTSFHDNPAVLP